MKVIMLLCSRLLLIIVYPLSKYKQKVKNHQIFEKKNTNKIANPSEKNRGKFQGNRLNGEKAYTILKILISIFKES